MMNSFVFLFMIRSNTVYTISKFTDNTRAIRWRNRVILYLRIIVLIDYVMEENLFVNVEYSPVKHAASRFSFRKNATDRE